MLERSFNFKDLDEIELELQRLNSINFDNIKKCSKIIDELDSEYVSYVEKFKLQTLKLKYQKLRRVDKIYKEVIKDLSSDDVKYLSQKSKDNLIKFQNLLVNLGKLWVFDIQNSLKMRKINLQKLKDVLISQKEIICKHIVSKDSNERKKIYKQFLQNESELHKMYKQYDSIFLRQDNIDDTKHAANSILNDCQNIWGLIVKNLQTTFWLCVFFGACFCIPYFFSIEQIPQINLNDVLYLLFSISILAFLYIGIIAIFLMLYGYAIFKNYTKYNFFNYIFWIMQFFIFVVCCLPFVYDIENIKSFCEIIFKNFDWIAWVYFCLLTMYFGFGIYKNKTYKDGLNLPALIITLYFDLLFITFVYKRHQDINPFLLLIVFLLLFLIKLSAFSRTFEYKIIFYFSITIGVLAMFVFSPSFVKIVKLANYKDDFAIKNEFINQEILNKIPICFSDYNNTCIDDKASDGNKTTINNLLVKVKFDDRYHFIADTLNDEFNITKEYITKDEISTDISQRMFEIFKVKSCKQDPDAPCYIENEKEQNITVKNYHKGFENIQKKNNKFFIEFKIKKENIAN